MSTTADLGWGPLAQPLHPAVPADTRPWRENAFFCFWDRAQDLTGVMHISASPNARAGRRARVSVQLGAVTTEVVEPLDPATFDSRSISFVPDRGFAIDTTQLKGSITGAPLHPLAVFAGDRAPQAFSLDDEHPIHHYQRSARVTGELTVLDRPIAVDGFGYRDRTWGFRDESHSVEEYYGCMWVFPGYSISAMRLRGLDGREATLGSVCHADGSTTAVTGMSMVRDGAGLFIRSVLTLGDGHTLAVASAGRRSTFWCPMGAERQDGPTLSAYDQFDDLVLPDGTTGFGLLEQGIIRRLH